MFTEVREPTGKTPTRTMETDLSYAFVGDGNIPKSSRRESLQRSADLEEDRRPTYILSEEFQGGLGRTGDARCCWCSSVCCQAFPAWERASICGSLVGLLVVQ